MNTHTEKTGDQPDPNRGRRAAERDAQRARAIGRAKWLALGAAYLLSGVASAQALLGLAFGALCAAGGHFRDAAAIAAFVPAYSWLAVSVLAATGIVARRAWTRGLAIHERTLDIWDASGERLRRRDREAAASSVSLTAALEDLGELDALRLELGAATLSAASARTGLVENFLADRAEQIFEWIKEREGELGFDPLG